MRNLKKRLGDMLLEKKLLTEEKLSEALKQQKLRKQRLGRVLVDLNIVTEKDILNVISEQLNIPIMDISTMIIEKEVAALIDPDFARDKLVIPLMLDGNKLVVGMADPLDVFSLEKLENSLKMPIDVVICPELQITNAIASVYGAINQTVSALVSEAELQSEQEMLDRVDSDITDILGKSEDSDPVVKLVSEVIKDAASNGLPTFTSSRQKKAWSSVSESTVCWYIPSTSIPSCRTDLSPESRSSPEWTSPKSASLRTAECR